jgi:hypothetical protein
MWSPARSVGPEGVLAVTPAGRVNRTITRRLVITERVMV